jgi:hypothetical protein
MRVSSASGLSLGRRIRERSGTSHVEIHARTRLRLKRGLDQSTLPPWAVINSAAFQSRVPFCTFARYRARFII